MDAWLHIGMPKTGPTSVQETLAFVIRDQAFEYCGFGLDPLLNLPAPALEQLVVASGSRDTSEQALARLERGLAVAPTVHVARRYLRRKMRHIRSGC